MSMKLSSAAFLAVILFSVICDYCLQATQNDEGKKRRRDKDEALIKVLPTAAKKSVTTNAGSTNCDEWNLDSVIQIEINGEPTCIASLIDQRGCNDFSTIITVDGTLHATIAAPMDCLEKIRANAGRVKAKTADGTLIPFAYNDELDFTLLEPAKVKLIPHVRKKLSIGTKGMSTVWKDGKVTLKEFVIVDHHNCDIEKEHVHNDVYFCAKSAGKEKISAGKGAPFFLKRDGRQVAMGLQMDYHNTTGGNRYGVIQVGTLVKVPESELELTSSGVFDFDSVINVEQNGTHLCLACAFFIPDILVSVLLPTECVEEMEDDVDVIYKTVDGEEFPIQLSDDNGTSSHYMRHPYNGKLSLKLNARLPIGTKGMAATWDKGNVAWKEFIVTDIADCDVDALVIVLKYGTGTLERFFCIKHVAGVKLNAGLGSPFFIKVSGTQYLVGVQRSYADETGGNLYYRGSIDQKS